MSHALDMPARLLLAVCLFEAQGLSRILLFKNGAPIKLQQVHILSFGP